MNIKGKQYHSIIYSMFNGEVQGYMESSQLKVNCPLCQQRDGLHTPDGKFNLEINTEHEVFHCWKCAEPSFSGHLSMLVNIFGTKGDKDLYKSYAGSYFDRFEQFKKNLQVEEDVEVIIDLPQEYISFSEMDINNPDHMAAYSYMVVNRSISSEKLKKYRIGFCIEGYYKNRIIIPSYNANGLLNYFVARSFIKDDQPPYKNPKVNKDTIIFNEGFINWDSTIYLVEGVFEMLSIENAVPQLGKTISKRMFNVIKEKKPHVVIVLDPDAYVNAIKMFQLLIAIYGSESKKVKIVKLKGKMDLDEIRRNVGINKVREVLREATTLSTDDYLNQRKLNNPYVWKSNRRFGAYRKNQKW